MRKFLILAAFLAAVALSGCESLYYSLALDKSVHDQADKDKFDRDSPDMMKRADKY